MKPISGCNMGRIINKLWWIILLLLAFSSFECGLERKKSIPPDLKDKIVFLCSDGICTINPDGTGLKVIVSSEDGGPFSDVQWSFDKRRIGFTGHIEGQQRIFLADSDGSHRKILSLPKKSLRIPEQKYDLAFAGWSPSGRYVSYRQKAIGKVHYGIMRLRGRAVTPLGGFSPPSFGGKDDVVYVVHYGGKHITGADIFIYNLKTEEKRNLTNTGGDRPMDFRPSLSPDGKLIAFTHYGQSQDESDRELKFELWVMHSDGSGKKKLASRGKEFQGRWLSGVKFSPDGQRLMFIHDEEEKSRIYVINSDGTALRAITDKIVKANAGASWSPDGKLIVFTSDKDGNDELYVVNMDGTALRRLTSNSAMDCCPDW